MRNRIENYSLELEIELGTQENKTELKMKNRIMIEGSIFIDIHNL